MKRLNGSLLAVLCLACAELASAQGPTTAAPQGDLYPVMATDQKVSLPRINPRELLPRNWFGAGSPEPAMPKPAPVNTAASGPTTSGPKGTAQSRLLHDVRRSEAAMATDGRMPTARAGSALSPNAPRSGAESATQASTNARLARSIAAEAASAVSNTTPTPQPVKTHTPDDIAPLVAGTNEIGPTLSEVAPPPAPIPAPADDITPLPAEEEAAETNADQFAETNSGRVKVASKPAATTKLPMFIGDRYSTTEKGSSFGATAPVDKTPVESSKASTGDKEDDFLLTQKMPVLVSKVGGPRTIVVGREATYRVLLANRGDIAAEQVVTNVNVPEGAEVVGVESVDGVIEQQGNSGVIVWRTQRLETGAVAKLDLRLVARTGSPIELGVTHTHKPIDGTTLVNVQEPKLALAIVGPEEVLYGKPQTFRLTISNPGTGTAESVALHLTPPGGDADRRTSHEFGNIGAGEERTVEIELTAREAGQLAVNASASAQNGVAAELTKQVFCRKAELVVDWRGPADRYAGAPAAYYFRVRNPGTAAAPDVVLDVTLPAGFELLPVEGTPAARDNCLAYRVGSLEPGAERVIELRGVLRQAGANTIGLRAAATDETRSEAVDAVTEVVALADLKLDVLDPKGPVATNQEVIYEIRITNRGSSDAHDVRVVGLFSEGIDPHHVDGETTDLSDGRVAFKTIERLAAGEKRVFKIHARAHEEGTHLFRAEVLCRDLEIKLAAEETTRFFTDDAINVAADAYPASAGTPVFPR